MAPDGNSALKVEANARAADLTSDDHPLALR
jgi:hypothetical protein